MGYLITAHSGASQTGSHATFSQRPMLPNTMLCDRPNQRSQSVVLRVQEDLVLSRIRPYLLLQAGHSSCHIDTHLGRSTDKDARSSTKLPRQPFEHVRYVGPSILCPPAISPRGSWEEGEPHQVLLKLCWCLRETEVEPLAGIILCF